MIIELTAAIKTAVDELRLANTPETWAAADQLWAASHRVRHIIDTLATKPGISNTKRLAYAIASVAIAERVDADIDNYDFLVSYARSLRAAIEIQSDDLSPTNQHRVRIGAAVLCLVALLDMSVEEAERVIPILQRVGR